MPMVCIVGVNAIAKITKSKFEAAVIARDLFIAFSDIRSGWSPTNEEAIQ